MMLSLLGLMSLGCYSCLKFFEGMNGNDENTWYIMPFLVYHRNLLGMKHEEPSNTEYQMKCHYYNNYLHHMLLIM